jgi:hypothetical protein
VTKVTGTGSCGDNWVMLDAGAHVMLDFTDAGLASTYRQPMPQIERTFVELTDHLTVAGCGVNFIEVADGIYQRETSRLIESEIFRSTVDVVLFAAPDAIGAVAGVAHLRSKGLDVAAVSGRITRSPLATREAQDELGLPVLDLAQLGDAATVAGLLGVDPQLLDAPVAEIPVSRPGPDLTLVGSAEDPDDIDDHPAPDEAVLYGDGTPLAGRR